jgi:hypothetical protein
MFNAGKRTDNRAMQAHIRGRFLIHAASRPCKEPELRWIEQLASPVRIRFARMPEGALVGVASLVASLTPHAALNEYPEQRRWIAGPWCWMLADVREFATPIPCKGQQGWFNVSITPTLLQTIDDARRC